ncbi:MAG: hypothetical protein F6K30_15180 [Cyanothece sp. SIO2G6]|nr:hypothetical protein [Cyanothece sp. SIO2G6]
MEIYDPRKISTRVYRNLSVVKRQAGNNQKILDEQKSQAVELYTYAATWGLLRLRGEETALSKKSHSSVVRCFFKTLGELAFPGEDPNPLLEVGDGIERLSDPQTMTASAYLGLTGLALQVAREFSFWAESLYAKPTSASVSSDTVEESAS